MTDQTEGSRRRPPRRLFTPRWTRMPPRTDSQRPGGPACGGGEASSWGFRIGEEMAAGLRAWGRVSRDSRVETWIAWSVPLWSPVMVKIPRRDKLSGRTRDELAREAETVLAVSHPAVQRLLEARLDAPLPHLVYEHLEGRTVADRLKAVGRLAPSHVIRLGTQLGATLHHLHGRGIVHLDVKPSSVFLRDGRAILLDFDIALPVGGSRPSTKPRGSPAYQAPEQVRCEPAATSMDLWALGATLHEAAAGRPAFETGGPDSPYRYPQLEERAAPLRTLHSSIPVVLERLVSRLLDPLPSCRPSAAMAVLGLLEGALPDGEEGLWPTASAGRSTKVRVNSVGATAYR